MLPSKLHPHKNRFVIDQPYLLKEALLRYRSLKIKEKEEQTYQQIKEIQSSIDGNRPIEEIAHLLNKLMKDSLEGAVVQLRSGSHQSEISQCLRDKGFQMRAGKGIFVWQWYKEFAKDPSCN